MIPVAMNLNTTIPSPWSHLRPGFNLLTRSAGGTSDRSEVRELRRSLSYTDALLRQRVCLSAHAKFKLTELCAFVSCLQFILSGALHYLDDTNSVRPTIIWSRPGQKFICISPSVLTKKGILKGGRCTRMIRCSEKSDAICHQLVFP